jgi:hypothetical protein
MHVEVLDHGSGDKPELILGRRKHICGLTEHDLHDIEFALAQRRAMSKRCDAETGEHTCGNAPDDGHLRHLCRACTHEWPREQPGQPEEQEMKPRQHEG